ncbi:HNH endonuclease [Morganella morganii]|uniref:HNH endonuclease n=1 Tax=Morganella morganii TaxID=582 RepID=UPI0034E4E1AD
MARARNIKPGFFSNDELAECDPFARLLFIGLWTIADREGRCEDRPKKIKVLTLPFDNVDIDSMLDVLNQKGFIRRYQIDGQAYLQIVNWAKHQNPHHKEIASVIPAPDEHQDTVCDDYVPLSNTIRERIKNRDGEKCNYCGSTSDLQIDHITPVSKGGNSNDENLQVLCKSCNLLKFNHIINQRESIKQGKVILASSMNQGQVNEIASCPTDSLNLIPDSLNPINTQAEKPACPDEQKNNLASIHQMSSKYAFEGDVIRLNHKDFAEWSGLYSNIDLTHELKRLDIEFRAEKPKNWFITASQKLNYQNKNSVPARRRAGDRIVQPSRVSEFIPEDF